MSYVCSILQFLSYLDEGLKNIKYFFNIKPIFYYRLLTRILNRLNKIIELVCLNFDPNINTKLLSSTLKLLYIIRRRIQNLKIKIHDIAISDEIIDFNSTVNTLLTEEVYELIKISDLLKLCFRIL